MLRALNRFFGFQAASGVVLVLAAALALALANSAWSAGYFAIWQTPLGVHIGHFEFERSLEWFVNDVLMVIFFFVVGLEIRREVQHGELSSLRRAALPAAAALGGMLAPAAIYLLIAGGAETRSGWGVPMATDIAFATGVLALLGSRVPRAMRVLLLALAVIDDLGAIVVIASFYSSHLAFPGLLLAAMGVATIWCMQRLGVRAKAAYLAPGFVVWAGIYSAGIHPTIAGVVVGLMTPVQTLLGPAHSGASQHPAESLIQALEPWVAFAIMPIFALANAGVPVSVGSGSSTASSVSMGVAVGLLVGKPLGILLASWFALRTKIGIVPDGISARHLVVLGVVAGIGFTMALFVSQLAFPDFALLAAAKLGVLAASGAAALLGLLLGRVLLPSGWAPKKPGSGADVHPLKRPSA